MFTKKERRLFDGHFQILKECDNMIEVMSITTGHCWIIKKNDAFRNRYHIELYHKHNQENPYYHMHAKAHTVAFLVDAIRQHDAYVLSKTT